MNTTRHVEVLAISDPDGAEAFASLLNDPELHVSDVQTFPMGDGSVLRVVDYRKAAPPKVRPMYTPPVC